MSRRVALVIGNQNYGDNARDLQGPRNDATRMAHLFADLGFELIAPQYDIDKGTMRAFVRTFAEALEKGGIAAFYYSGHGIQGPGGGNYLMPVNARLYEPVDIDEQCYPVAAIVEKIVEKKCTGLLFLDACRNNPFQGIPETGRKKSVTIHRPGLDTIPKDELPDILISYATGPGSTAEDGEGAGHSPYTDALIEHLPRPGVAIEELLKHVRSMVAEKTGMRQQPVFDGQLVTRNLTLAGSLNKPGDDPPDEPDTPPPGWWKRRGLVTLSIGMMAVVLIAAFLYRYPELRERLLTSLIASQPQPIVRTPASADLLRQMGDINADAEQGEAMTARIEASLTGASRLNGADRLAVANGLVRMASDVSRRGLSPKGRLNLFYLLGRIDESDWDQPSWAATRAEARRAFSDLETLARTGGTSIGQQTRDAMNALRPLLFVMREPRPLVVNFANIDSGGSMTRAQAAAAGDMLGGLNWDVSGIDGAPATTRAAAGRNEVRYGQAGDREVAVKAVLDLQAAGYAMAASPVQFAAIGSGPIEVWLSQPPAQDRWLAFPPKSAWCFQRQGPVSDGGRYSIRCHKDPTTCADKRRQSPGTGSSACVFVAELDRSGVTLKGGGAADSYFLYGDEPFPAPFPSLP